MNYSELLAEGKIRREPAARGQAARQLAGARRDVATAKRLGPSEEWSFNIAYNAMLLAGRAVMFSDGYRPTSGEGGHASVVEFLRLRLRADFSRELDIMDRMRRQRHRITYEGGDIVPESQIADAIATAEKFVAAIEGLLKSHKPQA